MANRAWYQQRTQALNAVELFLTVLGQGAGNAPILGEGDPKASYFAQPVRTGTGVFTLTTKQGYAGVLAASFDYVQATPAATSTVIEGPLATQAAAGVITTGALEAGAWTFTFNTFPSGSAGDLGSSDALRIIIVMRNSSLQV